MYASIYNKFLFSFSYLPLSTICLSRTKQKVTCSQIVNYTPETVPNVIKTKNSISTAKWMRGIICLLGVLECVHPQNLQQVRHLLYYWRLKLNRRNTLWLLTIHSLTMTSTFSGMSAICNRQWFPNGIIKYISLEAFGFFTISESSKSSSV